MHYLGILCKKIFRSKRKFRSKKICGTKKIVKTKIMAMDIIYKNETKFDEDNNFSIELSSNNEIQNMIFKARSKWFVSGLKVVIRKFEEIDEYKQVKKVSDLISKIKADQKNNIAHGSIKCYLPNFAAFEHDHLVKSVPTKKHTNIIT